MPGVSHENLRWALMIMVALLAIVFVRQALYAWLRRRRIVHRITRARRGESRARELLEMRGYCVIAAQFVCSYRLSIDGKDLTIPLRADYLVSRDGVRYVAEVKTGAYAPHLRTPATRRQLLEYRMAFEVDGVLLVDAEQERIHVVRFPFFERAAAEPALRFGWLVIAVGVAVLIAAQWR